MGTLQQLKAVLSKQHGCASCASRRDKAIREQRSKVEGSKVEGKESQPIDEEEDSGEVLMQCKIATRAQSKKVLTEQHKAALGLCRKIDSMVHTLDTAAIERLLPLLQHVAAVMEE